MHRRAVLHSMALSLLGFGSSASSKDLWQGWRGLHRDGMQSKRTWPKSLENSQMQEMWSVPLDAGYSGPISDGKFVYATETRAKQDECVYAFERETGKEVWKVQWPGAMSVPFFAKSNGDWIRSTPACDGERLYVAGMRDVLVCLNAADGKEIWRVDFPKQFSTPLPDFGFVCSPLLHGNAVFVQAGGGLVKIDAATGKIVWRALEDGGGMNGSAFSSPIVANLCGQELLLVQTRTTLAGVSIDTGSTLWTKPIEAFRGMNILTPTVWRDRVFTSSYGGKSWLFEIGKPSEATWEVKTLWENKSQGYMSSPIVIGSHLYLHLRNQRFICVDLETGKETWTSKPFGKYWSMVSNGEEILALDERGTLYLIAADPTKLTILSERKVSEEECWAHLALVDDQIFVRHLKGLIAFRWKG